MEIVYISYYFPPIPSIAVQRNYNIVRSLVDDGQKVTVLTTSNQNIFLQEHKPLESMYIKVLKTFDYRTILRMLNPSKQNIHYTEQHKKNRILKWLIKVNESLPFNIPFGEGGLLYILHGVKTVLKYIQNKPNGKSTIVITSFRPTSNVIIGYLSKLFSSKIFWVVSFHDAPYLQKRNNFVLVSLQHWMWKKILKKSDLVLSVTQGVSSTITRYDVNPILFSNGIIVRTPQSLQNIKFTMVFTGSLYRNLIDPVYLFKTMEYLSNNNTIDINSCEIIYAGKDGEEWKEWAKKYPNSEKIIRCIGLISNLDALSLQEMANINIMLTWNDKDYFGNITGKFYEYVGSRNPILAIVKGVYDDELEDTFRLLKCGRIVYETDESAIHEIAEFILENYALWKKNEFHNAINSLENLNKHSWQSKVNYFKSLLPI